MTLAAEIDAAVKAEREAGAVMAEAFSARFEKLVTAGGNDAIDTLAARQLSRYFLHFAAELRAEMHLVDVKPAPAAEVSADG